MHAEHKPLPTEDWKALKELPDSLRELGRAIEQTPANVSREMRAVEIAFQAGIGAGIVGTLLVVLVLARLASWWRGK